jgi:uncharacterized protein (TIGR00369 family)
MADDDNGFRSMLDIREQTADDGSARIEMDASGRHLNAAGTVHGGVLAS